MSNKKQNEELQSRREFFKKAAKAALPVVGAVVLSSLPNVMQAAKSSQCPWCGYGCGSACGSACAGGCTGCTGGCSSTCLGTCQNHCVGISAGY